MGYIMHYGGAGTTGAAVSAGVPDSAIPFSLDQFFWAKRLSLLGVGPKFPPFKELTIDRIEKLIMDGIENETYLQRSKEIAQKIIAEDGLSYATNVIKSYFR